MTDTPSQQNANRQRRTVDFIKRAYFRETAGGFVFRAPNPWLFGHADRYLVSAAQQDEIVAILSSPTLIPASRPRPTPAIIIGRIVVGLALMLVLPTVLWPNTPAIATVVFMLELSLFFLVGRHLSAQRRLTLLQPILASASKTNERLLPWTLRGALSPQKKATPRQMMIAGIINTALFVFFTPNAISSWQRHGFSLIDPFWLLVVVPIYFGIIAAINFYWALKKQICGSNTNQRAAWHRTDPLDLRRLIVVPRKSSVPRVPRRPRYSSFAPSIGVTWVSITKRLSRFWGSSLCTRSARSDNWRGTSVRSG